MTGREGRDKGVREKGSQCIVAASGSLPARLSHRMGAIIIIIIIAEVFNYSRNETLVRDSIISRNSNIVWAINRRSINEDFHCQFIVEILRNALSVSEFT